MGQAALRQIVETDLPCGINPPSGPTIQGQRPCVHGMGLFSRPECLPLNRCISPLTNTPRRSRKTASLLDPNPSFRRKRGEWSEASRTPFSPFNGLNPYPRSIKAAVLTRRYEHTPVSHTRLYAVAGVSTVIPPPSIAWCETGMGRNG